MGCLTGVLMEHRHQLAAQHVRLQLLRQPGQRVRLPGGLQRQQGSLCNICTCPTQGLQGGPSFLGQPRECCQETKRACTANDAGRLNCVLVLGSSSTGLASTATTGYGTAHITWRCPST